MPRRTLIDVDSCENIKGLAGLTEPGAGEPVAAVIDLALLGAPGDGKTELICRLVRTLGFRAPRLAGPEAEMNRDLLRLALDARAPKPPPTAPGLARHYVVRLRPEGLLSALDFLARARALCRAGGAGLAATPPLAGAGAAAALVAAGGPALSTALVTSATLAAAGLASRAAARSRLVHAGEIEVVFWDVAGEHVFGAGAAGYHDFLATLVARRREQALPWRRHAFAPILVCNPLALAARGDEPGLFEDLRRLLPAIASLGGAPARALIAISRWDLVRAICREDAEEGEEVSVRAGGREVALRRDLVRRVCLDAEDGRDGATHLRYLRDEAAQSSVRSFPLSGGREHLEVGERPASTHLDASSRRSLSAFVAELAYGPRQEAGEKMAEAAPPPEPRPPEERFVPDAEQARQILSAMTEAARRWEA